MFGWKNVQPKWWRLKIRSIKVIMIKNRSFQIILDPIENRSAERFVQLEVVQFEALLYNVMTIKNYLCKYPWSRTALIWTEHSRLIWLCLKPWEISKCCSKGFSIPWKIHCFPKLEGCGSKIEPATPIWI